MTLTEYPTLADFTKELSSYVSTRAMLVREVERMTGIATAESKKEDELLNAPDAFENEEKQSLLGRIGQRLRLAPKRIGNFQAQLSELDAKYKPLVDEACNEALRAIGRTEDLRYGKLCEALAPFFDGGLEHSYFKPRSIGPIRSRAFFETLDAFTGLHRYRMMIPHPQHDRVTSPHTKAEIWLRVVPDFPTE